MATSSRSGPRQRELIRGPWTKEAVGGTRDCLPCHSAAALAPEDYALLDLNLRQGLAAEELNECLGLEPGSTRMKLSSLCARLDGDVRAILLAKRARRICVALDLWLFSDLGDPFQELHGPSGGHVRQCTDCRERGRRFVSASEVFGALAVMPAPQRLRKELIRSG